MHNKLKKIRQEKNLTQQYIATKSLIPCRSYQRYECGKQVPNVYTAIRLAKVLNTTVEELFPLSDQTNKG